MNLIQAVMTREGWMLRDAYITNNGPEFSKNYKIANMVDNWIKRGPLVDSLILRVTRYKILRQDLAAAIVREVACGFEEQPYMGDTVGGSISGNDGIRAQTVAKLAKHYINKPYADEPMKLKPGRLEAHGQVEAVAEKLQAMKKHDRANVPTIRGHQ